MTAQKPFIALIHGSWHPPHYYRKLIGQLQQQGFTVVAPPLTSVGFDDSIEGKTYKDDVKRIHDVLLPYLETGREAVLVCHSSGGISGSAATEGQTLDERRARGEKGGIRGIVYMAAFALPEKGTSLLDAVGGVLGPFVQLDVSHSPRAHCQKISSPHEYLESFWLRSDHHRARSTRRPKKTPWRRSTTNYQTQRRKLWFWASRTVVARSLVSLVILWLPTSRCRRLISCVRRTGRFRCSRRGHGRNRRAARSLRLRAIIVRL